MPPKTRITRDMIMEAAVSLVREQGICALNARAIAKKLNCSTQPIFSNFSSVSELKQAVVETANILYHQFLKEDMQNPDVPPYKSSGLAYIRFAREEPELFKLLFMRDRSGEDISENDEIIKVITGLISADTSLNQTEAYFFHLEMWIYVHGIATMLATSFLDWDSEMIGRMMSDAYQGMKLRYLSQSAATHGKEKNE